MDNKTCYVFLADDYADWEIALAMAGLHQFSDIKVVTFTLDDAPVRSMGNLSVQPAISLAQVDPTDIGLLLLPGGLRWEKGGNIPELSNLIRQILQQDKGLAAICGATLFLAREGLLDNGLRHTSNQLDYLKWYVPGYRGHTRYLDLPVVRDGRIITAGGTHPLEFAREIFQYFNLLENDRFLGWFRYFLPDPSPQGRFTPEAPPFPSDT
jgi:putative intracellular protease/amidase